jgi:hypothetical protein
MSTRKSPDQSATLYKIGTKKTGNDGNTWIISETKTGVKRWKLHRKNDKSKNKSKSKSKSKKNNSKIKTTKSFVKKEKLTQKDKIYEIEDNGGIPWIVKANKKGIHILTYDEDEYIDTDDDRDNKPEHEYNVPLFTLKKFIGYWIGQDTSEFTKRHGNSILVQETKTSYVFIGWNIVRFETIDEIYDYTSCMGNSSVPYPIAFGHEYLYFMLENKYVPKDQFSLKITPANSCDLYSEFYGHINKGAQKYMEKIKFKKLKILVKRTF